MLAEKKSQMLWSLRSEFRKLFFSQNAPMAYFCHYPDKESSCGCQTECSLCDINNCKWMLPQSTFYLFTYL